MGDFLRWIGAIGLPFASLGLGFFVALRMVHTGKERLTGLGTMIAAVILCGIQLISEPVIEPIWLQYVILFILPALGGAALIVRPRGRRTGVKDQDLS
ncbi:hypothetical protein KZC51_06445 [Microbacterium sp. SSW1-49]|uniref:Uncharacterized protein n=1 Tax=Microbacterium croceum TaxID=2851645 RepID=A0ABT0FCI0_9MICO|nr:hypothetical protein [Microbacterium croceum]MCK2035772.1 hypothetical protein [Microbacterium croceum]